MRGESLYSGGYSGSSGGRAVNECGGWGRLLAGASQLGDNGKYGRRVFS